MTDHDMRHMEFLDAVARSDLEMLRYKEATYRGSWKRRGGVGTFMMLARKWDRLEDIARSGFGYDVFLGVESQTRIARDQGLNPDGDGTLVAEMRDLRRYLMLAEAEFMSRGAAQAEEPPRRQTVTVRDSEYSGTSGEHTVPRHETTGYVGDPLTVDEMELHKFNYQIGPGTKVTFIATETNRGKVTVNGRPLVYVNGSGRKMAQLSPGDLVAGTVVTVDMPENVNVAYLISRTWSSEQTRPGTPEDGGHHEGGVVTGRTTSAKPTHVEIPAGDVEPWLISWERAKMLGDDLSAVLYQRWTAHIYRLEPALTVQEHERVAGRTFALTGDRHALLRRALDKYVRIEEHYVLDIAQAPPAERSMWPTLQKECNAKEHSGLVPWQRVLYDWEDSGAKHLLRSAFAAWGAES